MPNRNVYILTAHADPEAYTLSAARRVAELIAAQGGRAAITNLHDIGFDPRFGEGDLATYRAFLGGQTLAPPADVQAEHDKLLRADALVVVFPVYWWAMPAHIKGWFDRVLTSRRAFGQASAGPGDSVVAHMSAHVLAVTGGNESGYAKRGYDRAMRTQIETGILEYSGFRSTSWTWLWDRYRNPGARLEEACQRVVQAIHASPASEPLAHAHFR
jgi:NAD(P)H dehydrogenase (quinone)